MAITTKTLQGTDSIPSSRITINDNTKLIEAALNKLLSVFDAATGKFNNYGFGSDNDIETEDVIVHGSTGGGISVLSGGINVANGSVSLSGYLEFGSGSGVRFERVNRNFNSGPGNIPTFNMSGTGATGGTGQIGFVVLPRLDTATINDIQYPPVGAIVYDVTAGATGAFKICYASGVTGSWGTVQLS